MTAPKPRRRTIRFAIAAAVCLLLGAVTTVGVAWWFGRPDRVFAAMQNISASPRTGTGLGSHAAFEGVGATWWLEIHGDPVRSVLLAGWPWLGLRSEHGLPANWNRPPRAKDWTLLSWSAGIVVPERWAGVHKCLPLMPLFPGLALDTALYAVAWYLLLFTPLPLYRTGRRRFRVSRGMCASCGYDLNASTNRPCPECGA